MILQVLAFPKRKNARLLATSHEYHDIIDKCGKRTQSCYYVSISGRTQGVFCLVVVISIGYATGTEPYQRTLAGIDFDRQRDEAEQRGHGKKDDASQQQLESYSTSGYRPTTPTS